MKLVREGAFIRYADGNTSGAICIPTITCIDISNEAINVRHAGGYATSIIPDHFTEDSEWIEETVIRLCNEYYFEGML